MCALFQSKDRLNKYLLPVTYQPVAYQLSMITQLYLRLELLIESYIHRYTQFVLVLDNNRCGRINLHIYTFMPLRRTC